VTLEVEQGQVLVLLGRSGSGKTTALRTINRMVEPDAGRVTVLGRDTTAWSPIELRRRIGYVIQEGGLLPHLSVAANVSLVPRLLGWPEPRRQERASCSRWWASRPSASPPCCRASSPAASASAWGWPARWPPIRRCCSWTSPSERSTR
jgi:hypothetical protein